jgi:nitroreductase
MDVIEAMNSCRAIRYFKKDPIPDETLEGLIHAATRAPNPGNSQGWEFIVLTDRDIKAALSESISQVIGGTVEALEELGGGIESLDPVDRRMLQGAQHLAGSLADVPAIILVCGRKIYPPMEPQESFVWSTCYPAAQNILLAARQQGIGSCFTTFQQTCEPQLRELLNIPDDIYVCAFIPLGYPDTDKVNFGPLARKPIEDVIHRNGWEG